MQNTKRGKMGKATSVGKTTIVGEREKKSREEGGEPIGRR